MNKKRTIALAVLAAMTLTMLGACSNPAAEPEKPTNGDVSVTTPAEPNKEETNWPQKPVQIVVPYGAGGDTDFNARTFAKYLEKELGKPFPVVNITGNGGSLGSEDVKGAPADGYKALFFHTCININQATGIADYGPEAFELVRVAGASGGEAIVVRKDAPFDTVPEMIEYSKKNPGQLKIAANTGATSHWASVVLKVEHGADLNIVNAGGSAERVAALLGNHVDVLVNPVGTVADYVKNGDFKYLAVTTPERLHYLPDVPTTTEQEIKLAYSLTYYMLMPKGTPKEIIDKLGAAMDKITTMPEYAEEIAKAYNQEVFILKDEEALNYITDENEALMKYKEFFK